MKPARVFCDPSRHRVQTPRAANGDVTDTPGHNKTTFLIDITDGPA